jgi:hypothetical protein
MGKATFRLRGMIIEMEGTSREITEAFGQFTLEAMGEMLEAGVQSDDPSLTAPPPKSSTGRTSARRSSNKPTTEGAKA